MATILTKKKDTTGAPVAGDLTNSSGGAELAVNTADKRLYTKDSGGNVVEVGTNPGTAVTFTAGTVSAPAITTTGDTNTGVFFPAADTIAFAEGGAEAMRINSDSQVVTTAGTASLPAITTTGDVNTGIFFPAADTIAFAEGGAEAMRIDSSGNVGIGTTSPSVRLQLERTSSCAAFVRTTSGATAALYSDGSTGWVYTQSNHPLVLGTNDAERMRIDSSGNVGIGTSSPSFSNFSASSNGLEIKSANTFGVLRLGGANGQFYVASGDSAGTAWLWNYANSAMAFATNNAERMRIDSSGNVGIGLTSPTNKLTVQATSASGGLDLTSSGTAFARFGITNPGVDSTPFIGSVAGNDFVFRTNDTERARITSDGAFFIKKTASNISNAGFEVTTSGEGRFTVSNDTPLQLNRVSTDGALLNFRQDDIVEGSVSVSGNTVSYNAFAGSHWSQLQQGRGYNPDIPRGTVMSSIGEMAEWKSVVWDEVIEHPAIPAVEAVEGKEAVLDEEGNVIEPAVEAVAAVEGKDAWTETSNKREAYLGDLPVGATFTEDGVTKTVVDDGNERLPKVKISDVVGDKAVYGVFQTWDEVQDMLVTSLGAFVVRIAAGVTVQIGDLLESNGDGCAKVQDDDVIRSKTIGKVTSTTPSATYADGSYTVPAVLYCG